MKSGASAKPVLFSRCKLSADLIMWVCIVFATLLFFGLAWQKYRFFNGDTNDLAIFAFAFSHTLHGEFFPVYFIPVNLLGCHPNWIILAWLPVYACWRSFYSLLFFQSCMLTVSAWPFYLLAKQELKDTRPALALGLTFLFFPTIASQHVNQIHDDQFGLPFLMFAFYYFMGGDFKRFAVSMMLACLAKETITITTAMFGVYGLLLRRPAKWVVFPLVFSVLYFAVALKLLSSGIAGMGASLYTGTQYLEAYGKSPAEVMATFLNRPGFVIRSVFSPVKLNYLMKLFLPVLYVLPFLSLAVVIALPNLLLNLIASNVAMTVIPWHYNILLGSTLLVASVFGIKAASNWFPQNRSRVANSLAVAMMFTAMVGTRFWFVADDYREKGYQSTMQKVVATVPLDASVLCSSPLLAHFSNRPKITTASTILGWGDKNPQKMLTYDYIVLDGNWRSYDALSQRQLFEMLQKSGTHRVVFAENNVALLERVR
ncbi:MAG TPA: DUF2079 domain-containing protein [Verrucomicrobiae bacterium]|nr:DUF2079 domain-containing protein [Verrucomicrobiae bacterium]